MDRIERWLFACDEENWLECYNLDGNRYTAGRGGHENLKRAERARILVNKIPCIYPFLFKTRFKQPLAVQISGSDHLFVQLWLTI